jgi:hypothetical protein
MSAKNHPSLSSHNIFKQGERKLRVTNLQKATVLEERESEIESKEKKRERDVETV